MLPTGTVDAPCIATRAGLIVACVFTGLGGCANAHTSAADGADAPASGESMVPRGSNGTDDTTPPTDEGSGVDDGSGVDMGAGGSPTDGPRDYDPGAPGRCIASEGLGALTQCAPPEPLPGECAHPVLVDHEIGPFDDGGFDLSVEIACAPPPERFNDLAFMAYIPDQGIWDELYSNNTPADWIEPLGDDRFRAGLRVMGIDETVLADIERCAGWFVGFNGVEPSGQNYALTRDAVEAVAGVGAVMEPAEVPESIRCTTIAFGN